MSKTLLIYERAVPITKARHGNWSVKTESDFSFARGVNSMPLLALEFRNAVGEYPIIFAESKDQIMPAILLGVREGENLFVSDNGMWNSRYIPAFARRYPYVFSSNDEGETLTLCIDEEYKGLNEDGEGERLFTEQGEQTDYLKGVLEFQKEFQKHFMHTQAFCNRLKELNLLEPMQAQFKLGSGEKMALAGFMAVNRERIKELSADQLAELAKSDQLELLYLHLLSMRNVSDLAERIAVTIEHDNATKDDSVTAESNMDKPPKKASKKKKATKVAASKKS